MRLISSRIKKSVAEEKINNILQADICPECPEAWFSKRVVRNAILVDLASVKLKIVVIGGGRMGNAFIEGLSHSSDNQIHVVEPNSSVKAKLKIDFDVTVSNYDDPEKQMGEIVPLCEYVLLCVKPQVFNKIKKTLKNFYQIINCDFNNGWDKHR